MFSVSGKLLDNKKSLKGKTCSDPRSYYCTCSCMGAYKKMVTVTLHARMWNSTSPQEGGNYSVL